MHRWVFTLTGLPIEPPKVLYDGDRVPLRLLDSEVLWNEGATGVHIRPEMIAKVAHSDLLLAKLVLEELVHDIGIAFKVTV